VQGHCSAKDMDEDKKSTENDIKQALIDFYADPGDQRTKAELAISLGTTETTLYRTQKKWHDEIFTEADKRRKQYLPVLRSKGYKVLEAQLKRSPKALELLFKLTGELVERIEQTTKYESVEQKREKLGDLLNKFGIKLLVEKKDDGVGSKPAV
jgi:hypothetical protein